MTNSVDRFSRPVIILLLAGIILAGIITLLASGGGGGGNDVISSDDPAPTLPSRIQYSIGGPYGDPSTSGLVFSNNSNTLTVSFALKGSYTHSTHSYTLDAGPVPPFKVSTTYPGFDLLWDSFDIAVTRTLEWQLGEKPTAGQFRSLAGDYVQITINNSVNGSGVAGVDIRYEGGSPQSASLTWDQFDALLDNPASAPTYQVQAAFTYAVIQKVYRYLQTTVDQFDTVRLQESAMEAAGSGTGIKLSCDPLNGSAGSMQLTWIDGPGERATAVGPGDDFKLRYSQCWQDDSRLAQDTLYASGETRFSQYSESSDPFRLGFSDVISTNLVVTDTHESGGVITNGDTTTINSFGDGDRGGILVDLTPDTSGIINSANVFRIAEVGASSVTRPFEYGEFFMNLAEEVSASAALSDTLFCPVSGTIDYTMSANPVVNGSSIQFTFNDCVQGSAASPVTVNGSAVLNINTVSGTIASGGVYQLDTHIGFTNIGMQDDVGLVKITGGMEFTRAANNNNYTESAKDIAPTYLSVSEGNISTTLTSFSISGTHTPTSIRLGNIGDNLTLNHSEVNGPINIDILSSLEGTDYSVMYAGSFRMLATDNSSLTLGISTGGATSLALDFNGDGTTDDVYTRNWGDLH